MKRTTTLLLALILLLGLAAPAYATETGTIVANPTLTLSADKTTLAPGQTVTVTLTLNQALSGLNNYQFNVLYDAARFELTGSTVGAAPTVVSAARMDERGNGECITISGLSTEGLEVALPEGTVATLSFMALETAELGETEFTVITQALPAYADLSLVSVDVVNNATVTIDSGCFAVTVDEVLNGTITADPAEAAAGAEVALTVTPADGYKLYTLTVTDVAGNTITVTDNTFIMPESNVSVSAAFVKIGDVDGNSKLTAMDAVQAYQGFTGVRTLTEAQKKTADLDGNGKLTSIDAVKIYKLFVG